MTRQLRRGWRVTASSPCPLNSRSPAVWASACAMAKTRTNRPPFIAMMSAGRALPPRGNCKVASSPTTITDADAAFELVAEFGRPAVAIVKHANPCGVALGASLSEAWAKALASDPVSAYGGVVALNRPLDGATADAIARLFIEVVIAPEVEPEAAARLGSRGGLRLLAAGAVPDPCAASLTFRSVAGGFLVQERDRAAVDRSAWRVVSRRAPSAAEIEDLEFAERVVKHVKSNAIV